MATSGSIALASGQCASLAPARTARTRVRGHNDATPVVDFTRQEYFRDPAASKTAIGKALGKAKSDHKRAIERGEPSREKLHGWHVCAIEWHGIAGNALRPGLLIFMRTLYEKGAQ